MLTHTPLSNLPGKTVKEVHHDGDGLVIKWTDGTYTLMYVDVDLDCGELVSADLKIEPFFCPTKWAVDTGVAGIDELAKYNADQLIIKQERDERLRKVKPNLFPIPGISDVNFATSYLPGAYDATTGKRLDTDPPNPSTISGLEAAVIRDGDLWEKGTVPPTSPDV